MLSIVSQVLRGMVDGAGTLILTRQLLPAEFGLVDMVVSVTGIIDVLKDFGLSSATIQKEKLTQEQVSYLFWINGAIGLGLTLLTAALAPLLAIMYRTPALLEITLVLSLSTLVGALSVQHVALLRRDLRFGALTTIDTAGSLASTGCAVAAALSGWGAWSLIVRQLVRLGVTTVLAWILCGWRPGAPRRAEVGEFVRFGRQVSVTQIFNYLERNLDNVLIGRFAGAQSLGLYSKAYGLMRVPVDQVNGFANVAIPALSRLLEQPERYRAAYRTVAALLMLLTVPLAPLAFHAAPWLVPTLFGAQWAGAVPIFQVLALSVVSRPILSTCGWLLFSQGRTAEMQRYGVLMSALCMLCFIVALPWGAYGVALAYTLFDVIVRAPFSIVNVGRRGPVRARDMVQAALPAWLCAGVIALAYPLLARLLAPLGEPLAQISTMVSSLLLAAGVMLALPLGRSTVAEGRANLRLMRTEKP